MRAEILLLGSKATIPWRRSIPTSSRFYVCSVRGIPFHFGNVGLKSGNFKASGQFYSFGVPKTLNILNIWSISLSPMNKGLLCAISAKIQPVDQRSTPREYYFWPNKISGQRYQRVTTSCVYVLMGRPKARANPKSASLTTVPVESMSKFCGLRSLWNMRLEWRYTRAWRI